MKLPDILEPVAGELKRVDATIRERLRSEVSLINDIGAHIVSAGGKRLRPALVLLSARALGCATDEPVLHAATIEFIHTATLLHDDVVDESALRRGMKTANAVWGNAGAVLAGDFVYSRSFQMMVDSGRMEVMRVMADTTNAIAEGEVLQLLNCGDPDVDEARYLRVIELKTARLFEGGCRLGAIAAEASASQQHAIARYGHHLGIAFQLIDDLLDYTADPAVSGKNLGTDLAEGKPTLPLIHAMKVGQPEQAERIRQAIRDGRIDRLDEVLEAVESTGAIPYTRALAERHSRDAVQALSDIPDSRYKSALLELTRFNLMRGV
ncbi:polyprenyl synthetase family protein [Sinimarinibacterium thermocellulolyticum]|uniref:Polyprenyl synthetase family protein n=1 Tax=Sinimarinibacterium thermocellulolyticum TaxID=3170016 RepID=A0ABV2A844_9GAMM